MSLYNETAADLEKKLTSTYIVYDGKICFVNGAADGTDPATGQPIVAINLATPNGDHQLREWHPYKPELVKIPTFDAHFFNIDEKTQGAWNTNVTGWLLSRKSHRQWKIGISTNTYRITNPVDVIYPTIQWTGRLPHKIDFSFEVIQCLLQPYYPSWTEIFPLVDKAEAVAISPEFAVCLSNISDNKYLLRSKYGFIGEISRYSMIEVHHKPSVQEVHDLVKRKHLPVRVVCPM